MTEYRVCPFCREEVDPQNPNAWKRTLGWGRKGQAGGSDIVLREYRDEYAHNSCIVKAKDGQMRGQQSLIG